MDQIVSINQNFSGISMFRGVALFEGLANCYQQSRLQDDAIPSFFFLLNFFSEGSGGNVKKQKRSLTTT